MTYYFLHLIKLQMRAITAIVVIFIMASDFSFGQFTLQNAFPNLSFSSPVFLTHADDNTDRIFVVEQDGKIKVFPNTQSATNAKVFLDLSDKVYFSGEMGLLGLAFHPNYTNNGYFYVYYSSNNPFRSIISRFKVTSNPDSADKNSEYQLLTFNKTYENHNGGWMSFRKTDGYLYISTGDGGSGGDPQNNAQNINVYLGKILRIDVDGGTPYAIPPTNPFYDSTSTTIKKEIYAWGLRNPWRNSFDPVTDWFWCADVGQNEWEEINLIESGKNYGWRCYEGNHTYNTSGCNYPDYTFPIFEYSHSNGCSITGGYVYRGSSVPELEGKYIYGDYCSKKVWALDYDGINPPANQLLVTAAGLITSFGVDKNNEIYITATNGIIYKFTPTVNCTDINIHTGWNLVSVPFLNNDMSSSNIFSNSGSQVFSYGNSYYPVDSLINGAGYWVKYSENQTLQICGTDISNPVSVTPGWNLIGPFNEQVPVQNISSDPPNLLASDFYSFETGYQSVNVLIPGKGYWVKTNSNGTIQFNVNMK
ncbi:MAG: PQQ-dependent sugar dehydrogenase [Ignavibacteriaceae bacterium]|jgi:glucose/arabinose dehydrogenase|nr:PQQ-dependent sugar dehydrogenase [Ignavibacteriaceae bacterium]